MIPSYRHALIIGAGTGLSASLARLFAQKGLAVSLAARSVDELGGLADETSASLHVCDASDPDAVAALFRAFDDQDTGAGPPDVMVYNPSARLRGPLASLDPEAVAQAVSVTALGAFYAAREAAVRMEREGHGALLFTGASAGVKGFPLSAPFAMGKFAQRGLAESMARELHPKGIHVAWINIDGAIRNPGRSEPADRPDSMLDPDAIAANYLNLIRQDRTTWTNELAVRPWVERF